LTHKNFKRSAGKSAIAAAAYRAGEKLRDERTDEIKDYTHKGGVLHSEIILPKGAPEWAKDREKLWNAVERREDLSTRSAQARVAQEVEIALPHELTLEQNLYLLKDFIKAEFTRKGKIADLSIHAPHPDRDDRNIHAHVMFSERDLTPEGFGNKDRAFHDQQIIGTLRRSWEKHANRHLERWGHEARIDMRSLEEQGIDREPTQHLGPISAQMERRGAASDRGDANREVTGRNLEYAQLKAEMGKIAHDLAELVKADQKARRLDYMTKTAQDIRVALTVSDGGIAFMMALNEQGLHVAQDEKGQYVAIAENGFVHRLNATMHGERAEAMRAALDAARADGVIIPTIDEQLADLTEQRAERRALKDQQYGAHLGATLYNRADMVHVQRDALRHIKDAHRLRGPLPFHPDEHTRLQEAQEQDKPRENEEEAARVRKPEPTRDAATEKREHKLATTEMTDAKLRQVTREDMQEQTAAATRDAAKSRDDEGGRELEREPE
jgi:hypothetical protein